MRVNIYAEEMTDRVEIVGKEIDGHTFTGLRFYLELPVTKNGRNISGPFIHRPGDDDSAAVTFWGKQDLRVLIDIARERLDEHYSSRGHAPPAANDQSGEVAPVAAGEPEALATNRSDTVVAPSSPDPDRDELLDNLRQYAIEIVNASPFLSNIPVLDAAAIRKEAEGLK